MKQLIPLFLALVFTSALLGKQRDVQVYKYLLSPDDDEKVSVTYEIEDGNCTLVIVKDGKVRKVTFPLDSLDVMEEFGDILEFGRVIPAERKSTWLGVHVQPLTEQLRDYFNVSGSEGVLVSEVVEDSPAEKAGIKAGDVILSVDREEIEDTDDLVEVIRDRDAGDEVNITISRDGRRKKMTATLDSGPSRKQTRMRFFATPPLMFEHGLFDFNEDLESLKEEIRELREEMEELRERWGKTEEP